MGQDVEQKKLNDYNAAQLGILDLSYVESYKTFLNKRKALKDRGIAISPSGRRRERMRA